VLFVYTVHTVDRVRRVSHVILPFYRLPVLRLLKVVGFIAIIISELCRNIQFFVLWWLTLLYFKCYANSDFLLFCKAVI